MTKELSRLEDRYPPDHIRTTLTGLLGEIAGIDPAAVVDGATIDETLRMESVAFVELHVALEDAFDCEIDPIRVVELNELGAIVRYLHARANGVVE